MWPGINNTGRLGRSSWKGAALVTLFFVTIASFLFWLDFFRAYEAELRILAIGKGTIASTEIAANLAEIAGTLSFYERVLDTHNDLEDQFSGLLPDRRKESWQAMVGVKKEKESDVLTVTASHASPEEARIWALATAETIFATASFYYNIRTDADLRLIENPVPQAVVRAASGYVLTSLATGLVATGLFFFMLFYVPLLFKRIRNFQKKTRASESEDEKPAQGYHAGESVPIIDPRKFLPSRLRTLQFEESAPEPHREDSLVSGFAGTTGVPTDLPVAPFSSSEEKNTFYQEANIPENLPFAETDFDFPQNTNETADFPQENISSVGPEVPQVAEPTVKEYKVRLNKLLANGNE